MKKLLYSLLTLAAALTVTSCLKEVEGGAVYDDGTLVDAVFTVDLGPQTKALDDGVMATDLYAGLYEVVGSPSTFKHVVHTTEAQALVPGTNKWKVVFPSSLKRGHSYEVVFWAQANGAPYTIDWATGDTTGPTVTVETGGPANDKKRDAFYNIYSISEVSQSENMENDPISLYRPFAQINILAPNDNVDKKLADLSAGGRTSSMTVSGLPNVLNLSTGTTSGEADYIFTLNDILEPAFGTYAETHQYMAMNYVLFGETGKFYPVTFEVNNDTQGSNKKTVSVPVQANTRTNIVGNIFADDFDFTGWATTSPGHWTGENVADYREVKIRVGGSEISSTEPETVAVNGDSVLQLDFSGTVTGNITATSSDGNIATVSVDQTAKTVTVHGVADGVVTITIVIPAGTKADTYAERTLNVRYKVGTGGSQAQKEDQNLSFAESYQTVTLGEPYALQQVTGAQTAVTYSSSNSAVATIVDQNLTIVGVGTTTITATAAENEFYNAGSASYELEVTAAPTQTQLVMSEVSCTDSGVNENSLNFSWTAVDHATGYMVSTDGTNYGAAQDALTYELTGLDAGTEYTIHIKAIGDGTNYTDSEPVSASGTTKVATPQYAFTTIAQLNGLVTSTSATFSGYLTDAVVSFVPTTGTAIIKDATGSIMYYKSNHGLLQGQTFTGAIEVTAILYNSLYSEITTMNATFTGSQAVVDPQTVALTDLIGHYDDYQNAYVSAAGLTVVSIDGKNVNVTDGTNNYIVFYNPGSPSCGAGDVITAVGTVTKYGSTEEIKVWNAGGLNVTSYAPKAITFSQPDSGGSFTVSVDNNNITSGTTVASGKTVTLTANAASGFTFAGWIVSGATVADAAATTTTFEMVSSAVSISASFTSTGGSTTTYTKVTAAPNDWSGTYIIVYESSGTSGLVCVAGTDAYQNFNSAVIANGVISSNDLSDCEVEIAAYSEGYSIKALGGTNTNKYIEGKGSGSNGTNFVASPSKVTTFALAGGAVTITNNTNLFVYNSTSGSNGERWRFYKAATAADNAYKKPALYKKD